MGGRLPPVTHYNLNGGNALLVSPLHDLNTVDSRSGDIDGIAADRDQNGHPTDSLEQEEDTDSADCVTQSYGGHSLQLQVVDVEDHSLPLDSEEPPRSPYGVLTDADVIPIEAARSRFLNLLLSNFITPHVISCAETPDPAYNSPNGKDKQKKRKTRDAQFEGDPKYVLPLAYVANLYETLISEINVRLATLENVHEKTMGVALEAAGGLYRRLVKLYPKSGSTYNYKRREMASAIEARNRFPHLISGEEKRVRFVVVHGLELVERPDMPYGDAEWFKRLTGRHEAAIFERDYKFFFTKAQVPQSSPAFDAQCSCFSKLCWCYIYSCYTSNHAGYPPTPNPAPVTFHGMPPRSSASPIHTSTATVVPSFTSTTFSCSSPSRCIACTSSITATTYTSRNASTICSTCWKPHHGHACKIL